jgi:hypothetical protein
LEGEKCREVIGAYSLKKTGYLNCRQYLDSGVGLEVIDLFTTIA